MCMRGAIETVRHTKCSLHRKMNKAKQGQATYDPKQPRTVLLKVPTVLFKWQETCVSITKEGCPPKHAKFDDLREIPK